MFCRTKPWFKLLLTATSVISKSPLNPFVIVLFFSMIPGLYTKRRHSLQIQLDSVCWHCSICKVRTQVRKTFIRSQFSILCSDFVLKIEINNLHAIFRMGNLALLNETLEGQQVIWWGLRQNWFNFPVMLFALRQTKSAVQNPVSVQKMENAFHWLRLFTLIVPPSNQVGMGTSEPSARGVTLQQTGMPSRREYKLITANLIGRHFNHTCI